MGHKKRIDKNSKKGKNLKTKKVPQKKVRSSYKPLLFKGILVAVIVFIIAATIFKITELIIASQPAPFPKLEISLTHVPIEQIDINSKDIRYPDNLATFVTTEGTFDFSDVEIKGRGNSTWAQPKKPYQIKLDTKFPIMSQAPAKKWLLLANYLDHSHLRNSVAFKLSDILNDSFTPSGNFIELFIDDDYRGLYYLTEKIEINKSRVNLTDPAGVLAEIDLYSGGNDDFIYDKDGTIIYIKDIVNQDYAAAAKANLAGSLTALKTAIINQDFETIEDLIDVDSFAKYYLLNEFTANVEAYTASFFMYQDGANDIIHAGPSWDFDQAFTGSPEDDQISETTITSSIAKNSRYPNTIYSVFYDLIDIPEFSQKVRYIYQHTMSNKKDEILDYIKNQANYIRAAAYRDQARWKLTTNFDDEVSYLLDWISKRYDHFEAIYGSAAESSESAATEKTSSSNTSTNSTSNGFTTTGLEF